MKRLGEVDVRSFIVGGAGHMKQWQPGERLLTVYRGGALSLLSSASLPSSNTKNNLELLHHKSSIYGFNLISSAIPVPIPVRQVDVQVRSRDI